MRSDNQLYRTFQGFRVFAQNYGSDVHPESQQRSVPNREIDGMLHDEWQISLNHEEKTASPPRRSIDPRLGRRYRRRRRRGRHHNGDEGEHG